MENAANDHPPLLPSGSGPGPALPEEVQEPRRLAERNVIDRALEPGKTAQQKLIEEKVIAALKTVYDPEIPVNIYELGLIYSVKVDADNKVKIVMTLTAPGRGARSRRGRRGGGRRGSGAGVGAAVEPPDDVAIGAARTGVDVTGRRDCTPS